MATLLVGGSLFVMPCASAEIYIGEGEYTASKYETLDVAEQRAIKEARRHAQEQAGVYIESYSRMKNFELLEDEVITIANGIQKDLVNPEIKTLVLEDGKSVKISATVKVEIDDREIDKWLEKSLDSRRQMNEQLEALRKENAAAKQRIAELEAQAANIQTQQDEQRIKDAFENEDKIFLSNQKVEEGWKLWNDKNFNEALEVFNEAVNLTPDNAAAYAGRGSTYNELKQYGAAVDDLNKAVELGLNKEFVYNNRGVAYMDGFQMHEMAIDDYNRALALNPNYALAYYNRGNSRRSLNQYNEAISDYNRALELKPNYPEAHNNRGLAYNSLGMYEEAIADYTRSIELNNPQLHLPYCNRGVSYSNLNNEERAIADYNVAIKINPNYANAYYSRGLSYQNLNQYDAALADYTKAIELNPNYSEAYNNRGNIYFDLEQYETAIFDYTKSIELNNPEIHFPYNNRGNAYKMLRQYNKAISDFNNAIKFNPNYSTAYNNRGKCYELMGENALAQADFDKVRQLDYR